VVLISLDNIVIQNSGDNHVCFSREACSI